MKKHYLLIAMLFAMATMIPQHMNAQTAPVWDGAYAPWTQGSGTQADPYLIEIPQHLSYLARQVNNGTSTYNGVYFRLTSDFDMDNLEWSPIGNSETNRFKGNFNGDGHFIDNVYLSMENNYCGLFGTIDNATITNLGVNSSITCYGPTVVRNYAGGIVAYISGSFNTVTNCYHTGNLSFNGKHGGYRGGIIGYVNGEISTSNCQNFGQISDDSYDCNQNAFCSTQCFLGGIIGGVNATATLTDCYNNGNIQAIKGQYNGAFYCSFSGGLVGIVHNGSTTVMNSYNNGDISAYYCGGLIGSSISNATGNVGHGIINISNSYNMGTLNGGFYQGGLIGHSEGCTITNSYNSGVISDGSFQGGLIGRSEGNISISNCSNTGSLNTSTQYTVSIYLGQTRYCGGIIGYSEGITNITCSANNGSVSVNTTLNSNSTSNANAYGGGIIGYCEGTTNITCSANKGSVTVISNYYHLLNAYAYSGGFIGYANNTITLDRCYNIAVISGSGTDPNGYYNYGYVGGLVGYLSASANNIHECYNTGAVNTGTGTRYSCGGISGYTQGFTTITNCYNTGTLTGPDNQKSSIAYGTVTLENCYYLETCGGSAQTGAQSKTSAQMQSPYFPGILNVGVQAYVQDVSPYVNQGYPIFGDMVYAVSTQAATNVGITKATLHGTYAGGADIVAFQYRENTNSSVWNTVNANIGSPVTYLLTGLQSNTSYIFRFMVQKNGSSFYGEEMTFTTGSCNLTASVAPSSVEICEGEMTSLTASAQSSLGNFFTYSWNTGAATYNLNVSDGGLYTVTVSDTNGCSVTASANVVVYSLPTASISGNTMLCMGESSQLTTSGGSTYAWSTGASTPSITVSHGGTYTVTVTNTHGCSSTASVEVISLENLSIAGNATICNGQNTTLSVVNGTGSYLWNTSDTTPSITVSEAGIYSVTVSLSNVCSSTVSTTVSVVPLPSPSISGNTTICQNQTTTLTANGGNSYVWSNASTQNNITVSQSGIYTVTATNAEGCTASTSTTVIVNSLPNVSITGDNSFCQGSSTTLTVNGANSYVWNNNSTSASLTVNSAGTYTVTGTDNNGCSNTASKTVSLYPTYTIPLTHSICEGENYNFYGQNLTTAGTYTHTLQTVAGCDSVLSLTLSVKALPTPIITGNTTLCEGETTTLTATGGNSYMWSNGSSNNNISVSQSGIYTVTATNAEGCSATANITVSVNPLPNVSISGNTTICQGSNTTLIANGADSYSWSTGENTASINVSAFGIYTVTGTSAAGCSNTATATVIVSQAPVITITGNTELCEGETTTLTANGGSSYLWSNGTTGANLSVNIAGTYQVIGYNDAGCNTMAETTVHVWQPATSEFTITTTENCYEWNGQSYCQSGDYTQTLQTIHGCDSVVTLHLTITVGIDDYDFANAMMLYPNPTSDVVNVQLTINNEQLGDVEIQLFDVYGRLLDIVETRHGTSLQTTQIDLSRYAQGVYFVKAVAEGKVIAVRKVVKQ